MKPKHQRGADIVADAIRAIATARGWEIDDWCKRAKVSSRTVQYWLAPSDKREREPSVSILQKLADEAGIPMLAFFVPDLTAEAVKAKLPETLASISSCPEGTQAHIAETVRFVSVQSKRA